MGKAIPNLQITLTLFLISLILLGLDSLKFLSLPKTAAYFFTNPISFGVYKTRQAVSKEFEFVFQSRKSAQENKALQEQLAQILSENANLRTRLAETTAQLEQNISLDPKTYNLFALRPIGVDRYLKVDQGSNNGLKVGMPVVFKDNYIGQILNISERGANVRLLTDPDSKISAFSIGKEGNAKGLLIGQFGNELLFDKILHEEKISEGDLVYSEGTEGFLPRGLILGRVSKVIEQQTQIFKQAKVSPVFDIRDLELVFVITE